MVECNNNPDPSPPDDQQRRERPGIVRIDRGHEDRCGNQIERTTWHINFPDTQAPNKHSEPQRSNDN